jgi:hypothetical protein
LLFTAFLLYYLFSTESYGAPLLAPFAPVVKNDLKDSLVKYNLRHLATRPVVMRGQNKVRFADEKTTDEKSPDERSTDEKTTDEKSPDEKTTDESSTDEKNTDEEVRR